jgi:hypothetical protein
MSVRQSIDVSDSAATGLGIALGVIAVVLQ